MGPPPLVDHLQCPGCFSSSRRDCLAHRSLCHDRASSHCDLQSLGARSPGNTRQRRPSSKVTHAARRASVPLRGAINQPKGVQQPHIPLLIAGDGEKVTLKLVAHYADACNVQGDFATIERKFAVLKRHCETIGRDYQSIHRTAITLCLMAESDEQARALLPKEALLGFPGDVLSYGLIGSPATIRQRLAAYEAAGVQELVIGFFDSPQLDTMRRFAREFIQSPMSEKEEDNRRKQHEKSH